MMLPRGIIAVLSLSVSVACQVRDASRTDSAGASGDDSAPNFAPTADASVTAPAGAWRAIGTEPFWALDIDSTGLRFRTPEDTMGIRWPPLTPVVKGDTVRWVGETERAAVDARIWPARCSDGMSDRVWPYAAVVGIDSTAYRGCAESRALPQVADALEGNWHVPSHRPRPARPDSVDRCPVRWPVGWAGNRLLVKGPNELLTFWDGVFFELHRE
jgi:uncharacterized membrane protein